jgi:predicted DNA-binding transcriptional regulator AlpA
MNMESQTSELQKPPLLLADAGTVAKMLSISERSVYNLSDSGLLGPRPIHLGKRNLWSIAELRAWVGAGCPRREKWLSIRQNKVSA